MSNSYEVYIESNVLKISKNGDVVLERDLKHAQSYFWKESINHISIVISQGKQIRAYIVQKSSYEITSDLIVQLDYEFQLIFFQWSTSNMMIYDRSLNILRIYNTAIHKEIGFIRIDPENNRVHILHDESFQLVAIAWNKKSQTATRYLNHYSFDSNGEVLLNNSIHLPVGFGDYHIVRAEKYPIYAAVLTNLSQSQSMVLFFMHRSHIPFNKHTFSYKIPYTCVQQEWIDTKQKCLYILRDSESLTIHFFGNVVHHHTQ